MTHITNNETWAQQIYEQEIYKQDIAQLTSWFANRIEDIGVVQMTELDYYDFYPINKLTGAAARVRDEGSFHWQATRERKLTDFQIGKAFFAAVQEANQLELTIIHEGFPVGQKVLINQYADYKNLPGVINRVTLEKVSVVFDHPTDPPRFGVTVLEVDKDDLADSLTPVE